MVNDKLGKVLLVVMDRRLDRHICHLTVGEDDHWYNGFNPVSYTHLLLFNTVKIQRNMDSIHIHLVVRDKTL